MISSHGLLMQRGSFRFVFCVAIPVVVKRKEIRPILKVVLQMLLVSSPQPRTGLKLPNLNITFLFFLLLRTSVQRSRLACNCCNAATILHNKEYLTWSLKYDFDLLLLVAG